jgi:hypothetical protein
MSLSQPSKQEINPAITSPIQAAFNEQAGVNTIGLDAINQFTPFGSLTYTGTPGNGMSATQELTPRLQELISQFQGTQGTIANTAGNLAGNVGSLYGRPANFLAESSPLVKSQMAAFNEYMQPTYNNQRSNLESQLVEQGITQGSQAWDNAMRGYYTSQDQANAAALMQFEPQAYAQAVQSYQLPMQTLTGLFGMTSPSASISGVSQPFVNTPTASVQPPNYQGQAQNYFNAGQQQFQNTTGGLGQVAGGLGTGLFGGPGGLGSAVGGLFGGIGGFDPFKGI